MRFRTFIIASIAILSLLGGYSFAKIEGVTHSNQRQITQHSEDSCKLKLFDLATGFEQQARLRRSDPHEAAVLAGALRVVLSIPSKKSCVPAVRFALEHAHGRHSITKLTPAVERELIRLAGAPPPTAPPTEGSGGGGGGHPRHHVSSPAPHEAPRITVTVPVPPPLPPAPTGHEPSRTKVKGGGNEGGNGHVETPPVKAKGPQSEEPSITTPTVEVPPITVETPTVKTPCVQAGPVSTGCKKEN